MVSGELWRVVRYHARIESDAYRKYLPIAAAKGEFRPLKTFDHVLRQTQCAIEHFEPLSLAIIGIITCSLSVG